jgi:hypothetical protein
MSDELPGLFAQWQPRYAALGLPTFPVVGKTPAVRGYLRVGLSASRKLASKFWHLDAFGLSVGPRNGITVLDVDTSDERVLQEALRLYGDTPFLVRSGRGNFQAWYRHNGEGRSIRALADFPIDILGNGYVVAPPSTMTNGSYTIIHGELDDLSRLPTMRRYPGPSGTRRLLNEGRRNNSLFRCALRHAPHVDDVNALLDVVQTENENSCEPQLPDEEVRRLVRSAWRYQIEGRNFLAGAKSVRASFDELEGLAGRDPDALALLLVLRRFHRDLPFALGKAMAVKMHWTVRRFKAARRTLEESGHVRCIHTGGMGKSDPPLYAFRGAISHPNNTDTSSLLGNNNRSVGKPG